MADRGRDLKVSILSDANKFDLSEPADDLETLGREAKDAGRDLDTLGRDSKSAGDDLERLGKDSKDVGDDLDALAKDARTTADKVDASFDQIAKSSKANLRDTGKAADDTGEKLRDAGEEGASTAREMGASFSGSADDITDAFQEVAANALESFGVVGTAAGVAAAIGIGVLRAQAEQLREEVGELTSTLIDAGGRLTSQSVLDKLREFADDGSINDLAKQARDAEVPVRDFLLAQAGDPAAIERVQRLLEGRITAIRDQAAASQGASGAMYAESTALTNLFGELEGNAEAYRLAKEAADLYLGTEEKVTEHHGLAAETLDAYGQSLSAFVDPLTAYTERLAEKETAEQQAAQATADSTKSTKDSWEDYVKGVSVSLDEYLAELEEQVAAQEQWRANMTALAGRVSEETLAALADMGPEGAALVAELVNGTDAQLAQLETLYGRRTAEGTAAIIAQLDAAANPAGSAAGRAGTEAGNRFATSIRAREEAARRAAAAVADGVAAELERDYHPTITPRLNMTPLRQSLSQELTQDRYRP